MSIHECTHWIINVTIVTVSRASRFQWLMFLQGNKTETILEHEKAFYLSLVEVEATARYIGDDLYR
jgi:hypothetical protein